MSLVMRAGSSLARLLGEKYDLIGFDPRGIGLTRCAPVSNQIGHRLA